MSLRRIKTNTDNSEFKLRTENRSGRKYYYFNTASKLVGLVSFGLTIVNPANARVILDEELCHSLPHPNLLSSSIIPRATVLRPFFFLQLYISYSLLGSQN